MFNSCQNQNRNQQLVYCSKFYSHFSYRLGAGMAQWLSIRLSHRPPTNAARVRFLDSVSVCELSLLLVPVPARRVFFRVFRFSSLRKKQPFQIPIGPLKSEEKSHPVDSTEIPLLLLLLLLLLNFSLL